MVSTVGFAIFTKCNIHTPRVKIGKATNMLRLNGWNPRGERLVSDAPMGHWETVTFIAGLRQTGVVET
jgi:hypothetical protein